MWRLEESSKLALFFYGEEVEESLEGCPLMFVLDSLEGES